MKKIVDIWRNLKKGQKVAIIFAMVFLVLIAFCTWYYTSVIANQNTIIPTKKNPLSTDPGAEEVIETSNSLDVLNQWKPDEYYDSNIINFVLLGFDTNDERRDMSDKGWGEGFAGARPDSIRVISINLDTYTSAVISIPRDTYIQIANTNTKDKINASYMYGRMAAHNQGITKEEEVNKMGIDYVMKTIENVLGGVPMDYYMGVDFDTVVKFVDKIGGVRYDVDITVTHPETGELMLEKGLQTLNGTQAFIYLQDRVHTPGGDMGRTQNHTMFLKAMMKQLVDNHKLVEALKFVIFDESMGTVSTNMSVDQIMSAGYIAKELNLTDINPYTLECRNKMMDGISYVVMDQAARSALIKKVFDYDFPVQPQEQLENTVPKPPTSFTAKGTGDGVVLQWAAGDVHNRAYRLFRNGAVIARDITENMFLDSEPPSGVITYEVQAVNGDAVSPKVSTTVTSGPAAPTNLKASYDASSNVIRLSWDGSGPFTIYKSDGNGSGARIARNINGKQYDDGDVQNGKTYTYRVVAVNDGKEGGAATVSITVGIETTPTPTPEPSPSTPPPATVYTLTIVMSPADGGTTTGTGDYAEDDQVNISATATKAGYVFDHWEGLPDGDASSDSTSFDMPGGDVTITAVFVEDTTVEYTVTITGSPADALDTKSGNGDHEVGDSVTVAVTPKAHYLFDRWEGLPGGNTTFNMPDHDVVITAVFKEDPADPPPGP